MRFTKCSCPARSGCSARYPGSSQPPSGRRGVPGVCELLSTRPVLETQRPFLPPTGQSAVGHSQMAVTSGATFSLLFLIRGFQKRKSTGSQRTVQFPSLRAGGPALRCACFQLFLLLMLPKSYVALSLYCLKKFQKYGEIVKLGP